MWSQSCAKRDSGQDTDSCSSKISRAMSPEVDLAIPAFRLLKEKTGDSNFGIAQAVIRRAASELIACERRRMFSEAITTGSSGWVGRSFDATTGLAAFSGQTVQIAFTNNIPGNFTGPGAFGFGALALAAARRRRV